MPKLTEKSINVFIVDDHRMFSESLKQRIESEPDMEVTGIAENAEEAIAAFSKSVPDVAIVDISLKGSSSGLDLIKALKKRYPAVKSLVLSMFDEDVFAERSVRAGAMGYVMKTEITGTLIEAIHQVSGGEIYLKNKVITNMIFDLVHLDPGRTGKFLDKLSNREMEIFRLIGLGYQTSEIADMLNLHLKTVGTFRQRIKTKLNFKTNSQLVKYAIECANSKDHEED